MPAGLPPEIPRWAQRPPMDWESPAQKRKRLEGHAHSAVLVLALYQVLTAAGTPVSKEGRPLTAALLVVQMLLPLAASTASPLDGLEKKLNGDRR